MLKQLAMITSGPILLGGCAVYNFAPPNVEAQYAANEGKGLNSQCGIGPGNRAITQTIQGANDLINNFSLAYRCAARQLANGRQHFEVPALLTTLGGATAAAFGAPASVAIGTGAAVTGLNSAKSYYAPKDKLPVLIAAVDAINCIRNESVATDGFGTTILTKAASSGPESDVSKIKSALGVAANTDDPATSVAITATSQYFALIEDALLSVENITAQRLAGVGAYAPDAILSELKTISEKQAKDAADTPENTGKKLSIDAQATLISKTFGLVTPLQSATAISTVLLRIDRLKPKLDECILRAKL